MSRPDHALGRGLRRSIRGGRVVRDHRWILATAKRKTLGAVGVATLLLLSVSLLNVLSQPRPVSGLRAHASAIVVESRGESFVLVPGWDGLLVALEPRSLLRVWSVRLPAPDGKQVYLRATPVSVDGKLVVAYQSGTFDEYRDRLEIESHHVRVIDLERRAVDLEFPALIVDAQVPDAQGTGTVDFFPPTAMATAALAYGRSDPASAGYVYVSYGGGGAGGDIQPWHGWVFELDLDRWRRLGANQAISGVFLTTPESSCGADGVAGDSTMICGGGVWAPAGPQVYPTEAGFELLVPTGNGQLDLTRKDYSQSLVRLRPGLRFEPGCDETLCARFDPRDPTLACIESCRDLFVTRRLEDDPPLHPAPNQCEDMTYLECLAAFDYDLGANAPVKVETPRGSFYVQGGKEGSLYLIDASHMGTLYDREQVVPLCADRGNVASCDPAGFGAMFTQPALGEVDGTPVVVVSSYAASPLRGAGLAAFRIVFPDGKPTLERMWEAPTFDSPEAKKHFRPYPSRPVIAPFGPDREPHVWAIDAGTAESQGTLFGVRLRDGEITVREPLPSPGASFVRPLVHDDFLYVQTDPGVHAFQLVPR